MGVAREKYRKYIAINPIKKLELEDAPNIKIEDKPKTF